MHEPTWLSAFAITFLLVGATAREGPAEAQPAIQERIVRMLHAIDGLDWDGVRAAFSPEVRVDYTSLFGGSPEKLPVDSLLDRWRGLLPGFDATQHLIGPIVITQRAGGSAAAETQARGYHYVAGAAGGAVWMAAGRYTFAMEERDGEWKIAGITFSLTYQEGNLGLPEIAQARAAAGQGRASPR